MDHPLLSMALDMGFDKDQVEQAIKNIGAQASDNIENIINEIDRLQSVPKDKKDEPQAPQTEKTRDEINNMREQNLKNQAEEKANIKRKNDEIEARASEARRQRMEREKKEKEAMERNRRKQGQKLQEDKKDFDELEQKKFQDKLKMERQADKEAKNKVKQQLLEDKERRRKEREAEQNIATNTTAKSTTSTSNVINTTSSKANADQTKLQIRLPDGSRLQNIFQSNETLAAVRTYIEVNKSQYSQSVEQTLKMSLSYPRKTFTEGDMGKTLKDLGMVPSACVMVEVIGIGC